MYIIIISAAILFLAFGASLYNSIVGKRNQVNNAFAAIDAFLKKRHDLIPNLVATVQAYMKHERETLTTIAELRARASAGGLSNEERGQLEGQISRALGSLMVAVERYPDLKANQNFLRLQAALEEIEDELAAARRAYNAAVTDYNNTLQMFPTGIFASMLGCLPKEVLVDTAEERENPNVSQLFKS